MISHIDPINNMTWKSPFITIDIDWAHNALISDTIDLLEKNETKATFFITHDTPLLDRLRSNKNFELGIHPNFNFLLEGNKCNGSSAEEVIDRLLNIVPEAKSIRSHSMFQNSKLLDLFYEKGLRYDCNHYIPEQTNIILQPWVLWNKLIRIPYFWEDDIYCKYDNNSSVKTLFKRKGLNVFDFHPIHIYLNTENLISYEKTRSMHHSPDELIRLRYNGYGVRNYFLETLKLCKEL